MQEDFEYYEDAGEPLLRGKLDEEDFGRVEGADVEQELLRAAEAEFRESRALPDEPLS